MFLSRFGERGFLGALRLVRHLSTAKAVPGGSSRIGQRFALTGTVCSGLAAGYYYSSIPMVSAAPSAAEKTGAMQSSALPPLPKLDTSHSAAFNAENTTVVFVLGGPGVGKGTQCTKLVEEFDFVHISAGDLLRDERQRKGSPYGELIEHYLREGKIVPHEITISLILNAMKSSSPSKNRFLIDGFPRNIDQGIEFETAICPSKMVLFFECGEDEMLKRLMVRSQSSGRTDDNVDSIKKRFRTFQDSTMPVREFYSDLGKLRAVNCVGSVGEVYERTKKAVHELAEI
ncbi:UMP-CMP kinase [Paramicrosporidium saccamoebae]|uniref:Uridylate kinase n=1 Tax=Paramicrosporidium saccamoebae TaxID=1246581 RepID=A0A2H9TL38_9FUNG|nr:UMP-CMP kinase [Paramicrosporidium saccamoebae]